MKKGSLDDLVFWVGFKGSPDSRDLVALGNSSLSHSFSAKAPANLE